MILPRWRITGRFLWFVVTVGVGFGQAPILHPPVELLARVAVAADEKPAKPKSDGKQETWQVVYMAGTRVGYIRSVSGPDLESNKSNIRSETEMVVSIARFGQTIKIRSVTSSVETPNGDLVEFAFEQQNPPAAASRSKGRVDGEKLLLELETAGKTKNSEQKWDATVKSPAYQERELREKPLKAGEKREFRMYSPELLKVATVTAKAGDLEEVELLDGAKKKLLKVAVTQTILPGVVTNMFLDEAGEALKTTSPLLTMAMYAVPKEEALKALTGGELDLGVSTLVKVPAIDNPHGAKKIVYRVRIDGEDPTQVLPRGDTQTTEKVTKDTADITVSAAASPKDAKLPAANAVGADYLAANRFLQIDDDLVKAHAAKAVGDESDPWQACLKMEKWVSVNLKKKNFSTLLASAAEVAKDLSGDCTEHATLLAAMVRTRKIPSRVAVGLVYVPTPKTGDGAFGGHMWTEVFLDGRWIPLDATLGRGGIGGGHLKFSHSSFADDAGAPVGEFLPLITALGKMTIEVREVESR
ncbi:MAG: transglutaminase domain-containing protein [Planctomycetales bacterium]|nr:transglutaminase domain-containing protein [Planctomycetales bacterium]